MMTDNATKLDTSAVYQLMKTRLAEEPTAFILREREAGRSYRLIAVRMAEKSGMDITQTAVRRWHQWWLELNPTP